MLNGLALAPQVGQSRGADGLGLVGQALARLEALGGAIEAVGSGEELLALFELHVVGVVGVGGAVAAAEEGGAVVAQGAEAAGGFVDGGLHVAKALVCSCSGRGGDVLLFELHLAELGEELSGLVSNARLVVLLSRLCMGPRGNVYIPTLLPPRGPARLG